MGIYRKKSCRVKDTDFFSMSYKKDIHLKAVIHAVSRNLLK